MLFLDALVERQLQEAEQRGLFDDLPGAGHPLVLDDDSQVPENLKMSYRILKMSGFLPEELQLRQEAISLQQLINQATDNDSRDGYHAKLALLKSRLVNMGLSTEFLEDSRYGGDLESKLMGNNDK